LCHPIQVQNAKLSLYGFTATQTCSAADAKLFGAPLGARRGRASGLPGHRANVHQRNAKPKTRGSDKRDRAWTGTILNCRWERVRGVPTCAQRTHSLINCASV
jgi:hypothetical protein